MVFQKLLLTVYLHLKCLKIRQNVTINVPQKYFVRGLELSKVCRKENGFLCKNGNLIL